jgi:mannose-6-phosphate isomerase-like protein (cupin superfamily)
MKLESERFKTEVFETKQLPEHPTATAPDGAAVRELLTLKSGSMSHFELGAGQTSAPVAHRTVEELWYFLAGSGQMWRSQGDRDEVVDVGPGIAISIPIGTHFQFRATGEKPLAAIAVTMPPWPGPNEAYAVPGNWG